MGRLMFVYLSGSEKGKTRIFTQDHVTIGTSDASDLKLVPEEGGVLPDGVLADLYDDEGEFHLVPRLAFDQLRITINGEEIGSDGSAAGHPVHDGAAVHFGQGLSSAGVLFQVLPENFSAANLVRRNNRQVETVSGQAVHPLTATLFVKELTASLWAEVPRKAKLIAVSTIVFLAIAILSVTYFNFLMLHRNSAKVEELARQTAAQEAGRQQDQELIRKQQEEIERLREFGEQTRLFAQKIAERYSPGICLIAGSYSFVERSTGRLLRHESADDAYGPPIDESGNFLASVDGEGPPVRFDFTGTGFIIADGVIATNKHVVQPWATDQMAQITLRQGGGFRPRLDSLVAFFPSIKKPFELKTLRLSDRYDAALCAFDPDQAALPILPLSVDDPHSIIGEPVVLMGYPTGVDGLLQRIDESERQEILSGHDQSAADIARSLAERGLIRPLTTTGTISDALPGRIVHSAQTTEGGSGSPMFDRDGRVIAINSAILISTDGTQSFGGSNFGVPIKVTYEMLLAYNKAEDKRE